MDSLRQGPCKLRYLGGKFELFVTINVRSKTEYGSPVVWDHADHRPQRRNQGSLTMLLGVRDRIRGHGQCYSGSETESGVTDNVTGG